MDLVNVANKVKQLRHQQKLTIDQLAARTGLSKGYISRLEKRIIRTLKARLESE